MKTPIPLLTPLCLALLAFTSPARAHDSSDSDGPGGNGASAPARIVELEARTALTSPVVGGSGLAAGIPSATTIPTGPGGAAALEAENVDGKTSAEVTVRTRGLAADTYTVAVTKKSDHSSITLGTFVIVPVITPALAAGRANESSPRQGSIEFETGGKNPLPAGFDGFDVATISVSASNGNVVLAGDFTTSVDRVTRVKLSPPPVTPTETAVVVTPPVASGFASIFSRTRAGVTTSSFVLTARGLPASAALTLALNGADVQPAPTDVRGRLRIHSLPATVDIAAIKTVAIHDAVAAVLLSGSF